MKAIIIGATGATGSNLVRLLTEHPDFTEIRLLVRKDPGIQAPKIVIHTVDFNAPGSWNDLVQGDVAFSCMGTTIKDAGSKDAQYKVDYTYQYQFAKAALDQGIPAFILVSAAGASENSPFFYPRIKGKLEKDIRALGFERLAIFKPGLLDRGPSDRPLERYTVKFIHALNKVGLLKGMMPLKTEMLARAMIRQALSQKERLKIISPSEIPLLSRV